MENVLEKSEQMEAVLQLISALFGVLIYLVSCMGMRWIVIGCHLLYLIVVYLCCKQAGLFRKNQNPPALYWMLVLLPQFAVYANMTVARPQYGG